MSDADQPYPKVSSRADYPAIERQILERWAADRTFEASVEQRPADDEYVFYDGPPFANGLPHYGHLLTGYVKDVVPRYQTMRGHRVARRFGWDTHGLPAEMEAEKELGIAGHKAINEYGIDKFNDYCRTSVLRYTAEWERYVNRQARWVDFQHDYKTMDLSYMESVIWAFKQLWDKGLIYEAYRVLPYSWGAETPLSNFEIRLDDATRPRQDPALTVGFDLTPADGDPGPLRILAWTTTPWTLPSNLALAVGPDLDYAVVAVDGTNYVIGAASLERYAAELGGGETVAVLRGSDLVGRTYEPMFPFFADNPASFRVLAGDFVDTTEGTGVVHLAPGFGEDDQRACDAAGIPLVVPVDEKGQFTDDVPEWAGVNVFDANPDIIRHLKAEGRVLRHETYDHNYPHCWRTDTPIIYRAMSSWYVRVSDLTDKLLAHNQSINWIPEHVKDGSFGKWLAGAHDWSISRNRFWGSPIPIWQSDDPAHPRTDVYGSLDEIERDFGVRPTDLHRPVVDDLTRPNPDDPSGQSTMRRVPEVLDCWFDSGSMPYAQVHYPFENKDWFDTHAPADYIVEYIAQTRGWFYTLHVLSVALFDRPAFSNVNCHGVVLDGEGRKLSKKLRNYPDPEEVMETIGSDALRWYLMASPILRGGDLKIAPDGSGIKDQVRLVLNPIWNAFHFFTLYANADGYRATFRTDATGVLDRYLLAKTRTLVEAVTEAMDAYDLAGACNQITAYLDALNNWYIRSSRERFWAPGSVDASAEGTAADKADAFDTLYTVLVTLAQVVAPLLPMLAEEIHTVLTDERSVHLTDWPDASTLPSDPELVLAMDEVRAVCSTALGLREEHKLRSRLPLQSLAIAGERAEALAPFVGLVANELNVKAVPVSTDRTAYGTEVVRPNPRALGPRLGKQVQDVIKAARAGDWSRADDGSVSVGGHVLQDGEYELVLQTGDDLAAAPVRYVDPEGRTIDTGLVVALDTTVTPELHAEGVARDLVRLVQQARRDAGLDVTDRIELTLGLPPEQRTMVEAHERHLADSVLATSVVYVDSTEPIAAKVDGVDASFALAKA
ncbi:MAG: isoleucine-tRNA ligase [Acidimicrobiales bacterium]|nr:isoleucine-tRNA ligase [Acidimicrobiales bacterium]